MSKKQICLTIGDPTGIGPEIVVKALQAPALCDAENHLIIIGHLSSLYQTAAEMGFSLPDGYDNIQYIYIPGDVNTEPGAIAYMALSKAVEIIRQGGAQGLVTGPISKENLRQSGIPYAGHTEILQYLSETFYRNIFHSDMLFLYKNFRMLLLTRHVPLRDVSKALSLKQVCFSLTNLASYLKQCEHIQKPTICMLGVNPHGGEIGGEEEKEILLPAIDYINRIYPMSFTQPMPADGVFRGFDLNRIPYDAYVAAYHDQGLIPFKMIAGLKAVNVTIGLPFIRTSVSHGMAKDIAGRGVADPVSLLEAIATLNRLLKTSAEFSSTLA